MSLSDRELNVMQDLLLINFQKLAIPAMNFVHSFIPAVQLNEPNPHPILEWLQFINPGLQIIHPVISEADFAMKHFICDEETSYQLNKYGIPEPQNGVEVQPDEIDLAIIPLLVFDEQGNRVGYGKGYYDRFLAGCKPEMLKIGLSFFSPVESVEDADFFDKKLDFCITPESVYAF
jgi:5-formyltetrahydrofolate cyclo-ligase